MPDQFIKAILITVLVVSNSLDSSAQISGYMGKRFSLMSNIYLFPTWGGPTANNRGLETYGQNGGGFAFDTKYGAQLNYVVGRRSELFLDMLYSQTGLVSSQVFYNLNEANINFGVKIYRKHGLAPLGFNYGFGLGYHLVISKIIDHPFTGSSSHLLPVVNKSFSVFSVSAQIGWNHIIKDRVIVRVGARIGVVVPPVLYESILPEYEADGSPTSYFESQSKFNTGTYLRLAKKNLLNLELGLGYLIF